MSVSTETLYENAKQRYAAVGVDTDAAVNRALNTPVAMHCWQADDVVGFEGLQSGLDGGGIMATGNYPGRARTPDEARADYEMVLGLVPGTMRLNIHACYLDNGGRAVDRDALTPQDYAPWMDWGIENSVRLDFNTTFFAHPKAEDGFTLSHPDPGIREFWKRHALACRRIAEAMARKQGGECMLNHWLPDGAKDYPADRWSYRKRLVECLDEVIVQDAGVDTDLCADFVESKLFGIGSEEYVVGSAEFYSSYALSRGIGLTLDMGHYHPSERIYDKISSFLQFHRRLLLHVSRPVRWDSDHVVLFNDDLLHVFLEVQRGNAWDRVLVATDFFDASINRVAAYAVGLRATRKGMLYAMLDPSARLRDIESEGNHAARMALMDEMRTMPFGAVWDYLCEKEDTPPDHAWLADVTQYERDVLSKRG